MRTQDRGLELRTLDSGPRNWNLKSETQDPGLGTQDLGPWTQYFKSQNPGHRTLDPWTNSNYLTPILI